MSTWTDMTEFVVGWKLYSTVISNWQNQQVRRASIFQCASCAHLLPDHGLLQKLVTGDSLMD
jgi:hypothetical protein